MKSYMSGTVFIATVPFLCYNAVWSVFRLWTANEKRKGKCKKMARVAVLTDSNSGITQEEAKKHGVYVLPTPFYINDRLYYEGIDLTGEKFYKLQESGAEIKTSMPIVGEVIDRWNELLEDHDEIVYIPLSSGLSASCQTAISLAEEEPFAGRVFVVNNQRISVTMKLSVYEAKHLANERKTGAEIRDYLEQTKFDSTIYIMVDTLEYLKKGGRITPAAAAIGSLLRLKPVLQIQGEKLDAYAKARTAKQAREIMLDAILSDLNDRFGDPQAKGCVLSLAYTRDLEQAEVMRDMVQERFPDKKICIDPLSLVVACHTGPGAVGITATKSLLEEL